MIFSFKLDRLTPLIVSSGEHKTSWNRKTEPNLDKNKNQLLSKNRIELVQIDFDSNSQLEKTGRTEPGDNNLIFMF